jgi:hypothetical protein
MTHLWIPRLPKVELKSIDLTPRDLEPGHNVVLLPVIDLSSKRVASIQRVALAADIIFSRKGLSNSVYNRHFQVHGLCNTAHCFSISLLCSQTTF